jgi:hypothetical protein
MPNFDNSDRWIDQELVDNARGLLATAKHLMTGMEIDMCEKLASMTSVSEWDSFYLTKDQLAWFKSLTVQFYARIANWKDSGVACS